MPLPARQENLKLELVTRGDHVAALSPADPERKPFDDFVASIHTRDLLLILNHCIVSEPLPKPLERLYKYILAILPLRSNGVRDVFEFVVAVHPTTQGPQSNDPSENQSRRRGPGITPDALHAATRLIVSPPSFIQPSDWFRGISSQLLTLLDSSDDKELASVAAYMIGSILDMEKYGKPGREGWKALARPILENVAPPKEVGLSGDSQIIVHSASLSQALRRLETLTNSHPNPGLATRLLRPIRLPLWVIASWPSSNDQLCEIWLKPAQRLLQTYLKLEHGAQSFSALQRIVQNLTFKGQDWNYTTDKAGGLQIVQSRSSPSLEDSRVTEMNIGTIDYAINFLIVILSDTSDIRGISDIFLELLRKWLKPSEPISPIRLNLSANDWESKYIETKLIQEMLGKLPEKLVSDSTQILGFVCEFLDVFANSRRDDQREDEAIDQATLVLSLLHVVLSSQGFKSPSFQAANSETLSKIETLLEKMVNFGRAAEDSTISKVAHNLLHFLIWRDQPEIPDSINNSRDKHVDDLKQRDLAMSYLTSLDAPPPVRAEGLQLLSSLIESRSIVLDVNTTIHLLCSLLQTEEEYIYLRTIKTIVTLSKHHPKTVLTTLLDKYIDIDELLPLDPRLRLGEALTNIIQDQSTNQNFQGPYIQTLGTSLLHISSLRLTKPIAAASHAKEKRLQAAKDKQAAAVWGGSVPDLEDLIISKQEQDDNEILSQILEGWHGQRNSEDIRIRTSALSVFSTALTTNINAFSPALISEAVDLSIMILKLETENAAAILRRAAILLIMSLVQTMDAASASGQKVGFAFGGNSVEEIREVLGYIEATDADGLVKRHASDVRESLGNWKDKGLLSLIGSTSTDNLDLMEGGLRGLIVNPRNSSPSRVRAGRPIIEEIE